MAKSIYGIAMILALGLAACTTPSGEKLSQRQVIEVSCLSVSTANKVLTQAIVAKKITKADDLAKIQKAKNYTYPICNPVSGVYPTLSELAMAEFNEQAAVLETQKVKVGE